MHVIHIFRSRKERRDKIKSAGGCYLEEIYLNGLRIKDQNLTSRGKEILTPFITINQIPIVNLEFST